MDQQSGNVASDDERCGGREMPEKGEREGGYLAHRPRIRMRCNLVLIVVVSGQIRGCRAEISKKARRWTMKYSVGVWTRVRRPKEVKSQVRNVGDGDYKRRSAHGF